MATRFSVATGNWDNTATWSSSSGGSPGASVPIAGDTVVIEDDCTVTRTAGYIAAFRSVVLTSGGILALQDGLTPDDDALSSIVLYGSAGGLTTSHKGITVRNASPYAHPGWKFVLRTASPDSRQIDLSGLNLVGNCPTIGTPSKEYYMGPLPQNGNGLQIYKSEPLSRTPRLKHVSILNRPLGGMTDTEGMDSGRLVAHGFADNTAKNIDQLEEIKALGVPVSFTAWTSHMQRGYVEDIRYQQRAGMLYFDIYFIEDR